MSLFVYYYVLADSWVGFAEKINYKDYLLTQRWGIEIIPEISLPPCIYCLCRQLEGFSVDICYTYVFRDAEILKGTIEFTLI